MSRRHQGKLVSEAVALLFSFVILLPFYMLFVNSLKDAAGAAELNLSLPDKFHFENFTTVFREANIAAAFKNSVIITVLSVLLLILFSSLSGYVIQRKQSRIISFIYYMILLGMAVPVFIVPTYILAKDLHLTESLAGIIVVSVALNFPYSVFLYTGFYNTIPRELDESAILEGCSPYGLFFWIIFPLLLPVTVTSIIIQFLAIWNDFSTSIYFLNSSSRYSLVMTTYFFFGAHSADWNLVFADLVMISLPVLVLYFLLQRYVISGLTSGAIKN